MNNCNAQLHFKTYSEERKEENCWLKSEVVVARAHKNQHIDVVINDGNRA